MKRLSLNILVWFSITNLAVGATRTREFSKTFLCEPGGLLSLDSDIGSVEITGHDAAEVKVDLRLEAQGLTGGRADGLLDRFDLVVGQDGNQVNVEGDWQSGLLGFGKKIKAEFLIYVPHRFDVKVKTRGGAIKAISISGDLKLNTSGGRIEMEDLEGVVDARTSGGNIALSRVRGTMNVRTSGGRIQLEETEGPVTAKTSGGGIEVKNVIGPVVAKTSGGGIKVRGDVDSLDASTSGGSITAELSNVIAGDISLNTSGGSVRLTLPPDCPATIDASTSGGRVHCDIPLSNVDTKTKTRVRADANGGGPLVRLRTSGGSVYLNEG